MRLVTGVGQDLETASTAEQPEHQVAKFREHQSKASIYYAYHTIQVCNTLSPHSNLILL